MKNFVDVHFEESVEENKELNQKQGLTQDTYKVTVASGIRLDDLMVALNRYNVTIPMGMCMNVGAGGHFQTSAIGYLTKSFGAGMEHITQIKIVLATGEIVTASKHSHPDLFWALRGGSPGAFGVVPEYEFQAIKWVPVP